MDNSTFNPFVQVLADEEKRLSACNCVVVRSVSGVVSVSLNGGGFFVVRTGDKFKADAGEQFTEVRFKGTGSLSVVYGYGDFQTNSTGGAGVTQIYSGSWDDPNGNITPDDESAAASYYKDEAVPVQLWLWSITDANWFAAITV